MNNQQQVVTPKSQAIISWLLARVEVLRPLVRLEKEINDLTIERGRLEEQGGGNEEKLCQVLLRLCNAYAEMLTWQKKFKLVEAERPEGYDDDLRVVIATPLPTIVGCTHNNS